MINNDGTHDYTYDPLYQIIQATHPTPPRPLEQFQYDAVGNWLGNGRVHNELNQLTEDDSCWYNYDADGNMTEKISKSTGDTTYFVWDIENKLTEVRKPGMIAKYTYDALGRRMRKEVNGVISEYRYDGEDLILEMNSIGEITANYTFGPGIDNPLLMTRNGNSYYYVKDGLGSVTAITDESGNVLQEYKYSVFGEIVEQTADSIENPFTYTAREYDKETGNYYYRARYYDPVVGRFISEDPIGFWSCDVNFYRYVWNNPLGFIDPFGLDGEECEVEKSDWEYHNKLWEQIKKDWEKLKKGDLPDILDYAKMMFPSLFANDAADFYFKSLTESGYVGSNPVVDSLQSWGLGEKKMGIGNTITEADSTLNIFKKIW